MNEIMLKVHINKKEFYVVQACAQKTLIIFGHSNIFLIIFSSQFISENNFELTNIFSFKFLLSVLKIELILA